MSTADKIRGGLYGVAIGDAMGSAVEFMSAEDIKNKYGVLTDIRGGGWLNLKPGEWTDDTEMTLAVAEGIMANAQDPIEEIGKRFLAWRDTNPPDIGGTIRAAFNFTDRFLPPITKGNWLTAAKKVHERGGRTAGNGALMRTLPVAFAYRRDDLINMALQITEMTHYDREAGLSCVFYCLTARHLLSGLKKTHAHQIAMREMEDFTRGNDFVANVAHAYFDRKPTGYTIDSLGCAEWAFGNAKDFDQAVIQAVNLGGDADTIGAITGGLAGTFYGYSGIPQRHIAKFSKEQRKRLDDAAAWLVSRNESLINFRRDRIEHD